jgi:hypothetical protein
MRHTSHISTGSLIVLAALTGACADANLTGPNAPRQPAYSLAAAATAWTAGGDPGVTLVSDGTAGDAVASYNAPTALSGTWTLTTTAAQTGSVTLPWSYSGDHVDGSVQAYAVVNNVVVGTVVSPQEAVGPFSFNGTFTFNVNAGDTYGFQFGGFDYNPGLSGTFTVHLPQQPQDPTTKDDCKNGGWAAYGFSDQGQCIAFVNTGQDSR